MQVTDEMVRVALRSYNEDCNGCTAQAPALRRAITAALAAMWQDHVIVPREPTWAMLDAARQVPIKRTIRAADAEIYKAMIASRPIPT